MEQSNPAVPYGERSLASAASPSNSSMFSNATGFGIRESHFTSVQGDMIVYPPEPRPEQAPQIAAVHSESGNYSNQLLLQGRGFPLYVPGPQITLPEEYRRSGVAIGDVGTVTANGAFDFFFNIYLPGRPPINTNVPDDFVPLSSYAPMDVEHHEFDPGNYVSGPTVHEIRGDFSSAIAGGEFVFSCRAPNGAVLALPHGAHLIKLRNLECVRRYAAKHAESWYKYANEARGRGLVNGSLYLVTGWEKAKSWGMASFHDVSLQNEFQISFAPTMNADNGHRYRWQAPYCHHKHADPPRVDGTPPNQTTFIHAFTISLSEGIWGMLFGGVEISQLADSSTSADKSGGFVPFVSGSSSFIWSLFGRGAETGGENQGTGRALETGIISDAAPIPQVFHPSQLLHERLFRELPQAKVVITHDDDWCDILKDDMGINDPNFSNLQQAIFDRFAPMEEDGVVFLRPKSNESLVTANVPKGREIENKFTEDSSTEREHVAAAPQSSSATKEDKDTTLSDYAGIVGSAIGSAILPTLSGTTSVTHSYTPAISSSYGPVTSSILPAGTRVLYWDGAGQAVYGTIQQVASAPDGTLICSIKTDSGQSITLPAASVKNLV
ncbi:Pleiotropic drug resistance ABC transporter protein [Mycena venus]|uniref:Pleiotropic drug resistance ABC transporter protein n=1 Tax=Mycena venus TaxID=2733690 RepID=A0A8H6YFI8_9AGAR|nr:Pleiotropic drug resistance ABC transporter protein [Mycena venus]